MTNRSNSRKLMKDAIKSLLGPRASNTNAGSLDKKNRQRYQTLPKPDFHETMFQAGRAYCESDPINYEKMKNIHRATVISEIKDKTLKSKDRLYHPDDARGLDFKQTIPLNLKFEGLNVAAEMARFGEEPHEYAFRCAIYVIAGLSQINGGATPVRSPNTYTT